MMRSPHRLEVWLDCELAPACRVGTLAHDRGQVAVVDHWQDAARNAGISGADIDTMSGAFAAHAGYRAGARGERVTPWTAGRATAHRINFGMAKQ